MKFVGRAPTIYRWRFLYPQTEGPSIKRQGNEKGQVSFLHLTLHFIVWKEPKMEDSKA